MAGDSLETPEQNPEIQTRPVFKEWLNNRRFAHTQFTIPQLAAAVQQKQLSVTVIIPGKEVASTIGGVITQTVGPLLEAEVVANLVVVDALSKDGTGQVAASHGAQVIQRTNVAPEFGPSRGKGDALWRGLLATGGDIVAFLDGDTSDPSPAHLLGILGPLLLFDDIQMVRACFDRPFKSSSGDVQPHEGGRVTEILARPLLNLYWPDLAGFRQPLAGEFAARRSLLEVLQFPVGYGIEIGTLVDAYKLVGLNGLAEVDVGQRQNAHKPLRELTTMAKAVLSTAEKRLDRGRISSGKIFLPWENDFRDVDNTERPPLQDYRREKSLSMSPKIEPMYPCPPFVMVGGVRMFRDIGRYPTTCNKIVRPMLIYRSGELSKMTWEGKEVFMTLGIEKIFDLRSPIEIKTEHNVHGREEGLHRKDSAADIDPTKIKDAYTELLLEKNVQRVAVPVFQDEDWLPENREARLKNYASAAEGYATAYQHTLTKGVQAYRPIMQHLAQQSPAPILFHCTAGKDRTGVMSMLILLLAGCDAATIAREYALNNLDSNREWGASATKRLRDQPGLAGNTDAVANVVQAREEYMLKTLEMFEKGFGGIGKYMQEHLGFDDAAVQKIRANIVMAPCEL